MHKATIEARPTTWAGRVPPLKAGTYADGLPFHEINYLSCKLVLRPNHFRSRDSLFDFVKILREPAERYTVKFSSGHFRHEPVQIREVLFVDTPDFRLYNNAFILRRRIPYRDGFPIGDPEIVFKFRHPDMQRAAETDVRPQILGDHRVKFKCQALPLRNRLGGVRLLFSHNVQFPRSNADEKDVLSMRTITKVFPILDKLRKDPNEQVELVGNTIIEEVQQDLGMLDFGDGIEGKVSVALWRTRGEHRPLIGEAGFQIKLKDRKQMALDAITRAEAFFIALQYAAQSWIRDTRFLSTFHLRLNGNAPTSHE